MKRALALAVTAALAACTPTYLESGRYACEPDQPNQCPGAWRCGLEGYCHQLGDTTVAWRCATSADCENHFSCGLSKSREFHECHDPAAPQDWPCEGPGDCVGGWSCGLSGNGGDRQCHNPAAPKAWPCETNGDCVAGWSCGLATDPEHHECHDPASPRAWTCVTDDDCLSGWRCGTERVCVDPSTDALGRPTLAGIDAGAHLNSLTPKSPATLLSFSPLFTEGRGRDRGNFAFLQDGHAQVVSFALASTGLSRWDLGTELPAAMLAHGARGSGVDRFFNEVPDELDRVSMLWPDGGLSTFTFDGGATFDQYAYGNIYAPAELLAHGSAGGELTPSVLVSPRTPGNYVVRLRGDRDDVVDLRLEEPGDFADFRAVPNNHIRSMAAHRRTRIAECVYVVDERGLWVTQVGGALGMESISSYDFEPVRMDGFTHAACTGSQGPQVTAVNSVGDRWLAVTAQAAGGSVQVAVLDAERSWFDSNPGDGETYCTSSFGRPCGSDDLIRMDVVFGPCAACPAGSTFIGMSTVKTTPATAPELDIVCGQPGAGSNTFHISRSGTTNQCVRTLVIGGSSFFREASPGPGLSAPALVAYTGSAGQIWFGADVANIASLTFDRAATGMVRIGSGPDDYLAFTPQLIGKPAAGLGLSSTRSTQLTAPVSHAPTFAVSGTQLLDLSGASAVSSGRTVGYVTTPGLGAPVSATLTRSAQATRLAVVGAGAILYAGDLGLTDSGPAVPLSQRLSLSEPITSLAFPSEHARGAGPLLSGYALVGSNIVRVVAETLTRWRSEAVALPSSVAPRATWFQGTKGRVGMHDGSVFSLPSRVRISQPLPGDAQGDAQDYAQTCGQQLALAPAGLFRLESNPTGPIGSWQRIVLPAEVAGLDFTDGRVHGLGNEVFVFTRNGEAARLTFDSCPAQ